MASTHRAPLTGKLRLSRVQEDRLLQKAIERRQSVLVEMGWLSGALDTLAGSQYEGWLEERRVAWASYYNNFSHRQNSARYAALFRLFNNSRNTPKRAIRMFCAQVGDAVLNTDPWMAITPEGPEDADPAVEYTERYTRHKFKVAKLKEVLREGYEQAAVIGDAVVKFARKPAKAGPNRGRPYIQPAGQVVDAMTGAVQDVPEGHVLDTFGDPVTEHDAWEPDPDLVGKERLKRDPETKKPEGAFLSDEEVPIAQQMAWGELDVGIIPYNDFICSPYAASIEDADYREHSMQWEEGTLRTYVAGGRMTPEVTEYLKTVHQGDGAAKAESAKPTANGGRWWIDPPVGAIPKVLIAESWMRFDLNDDGKHIIELCLLWDVRNEFPIAYEYMEEMTSLDRKVPFEVIRIIPEKNRWCGVGFYSLLCNEHEFIDRQWSRIDSRSSTSGVLKWHRQGTILEVERGIPIEFNSPRVYTLAANVEDPETAVGFLQAPELDDNIWQMLQQATQDAQSMSGTMQPSDSANSDLNQSDTLGEQELISQEGDLLKGEMIQFLLIGTNATLQNSAWIVLKNFSLVDARILMGAEKAEKLEAYLAPNIGSLLSAIKCSLTKEHNRQQMQSIQQTLAIIVGEGMSWVTLATTNPIMAEKVKPLYERWLSIHDVENPEKILFIPPPPLQTKGTAATSSGQPAPPPLPGLPPA